MAGPSNWEKFPKVLSSRRHFLEENIPLELTSVLIECGIIEPSDEDKLKQIRKTRGLRESQREFADILIKKENWSEKEVMDFKSCLTELSEVYMIKKIFEEDIEDTVEDETFHSQPHDGFRDGSTTSNISVKGNYNRVVNNSTVTINNRWMVPDP